MLSNQQTLAINLTSKAFFYLPSLPLEWEVFKGRLIWIDTPKRWIYTFLQFSNALMLAVQSSVVIYWFITSEIFPRYDISLLVVHSLISMETFTAVSLWFLAVLNRDKLEILNALIKCRYELHKGNLSNEEFIGDAKLICHVVWYLEYPNIQEKVHLLDYSLLPVLIATSQSITILYLQFIPRHQDPLSFIMDVVFADNPVHRNSGIIVTGTLTIIRAISLLGYAEVLRTWTIIHTIIVVGISNIKNCLVLLRNSSLSTNNVIRHYKQVYLIYKALEVVIMKIATMVITTVFWMSVTDIVVSVKAPDSMDTSMYIFLVFCGVVTLFVFYIGLSQVSKFTECSENIIKHARRSTTKQYFLAKTRSSRKEWKGLMVESFALRRIQVGYFGNMGVDTKFMAKILSNLAARVVDLLLLT